MNKKQIPSVLLLAMLSFIVIGCAERHPSATTAPPIESAEQDTAEEITAAHQPSEPETDISVEVAEEDIAQFQGEWKTEKSEHVDLIISGRTVNSISYGILDKSDLVDKIFTFYFEYDENNQLVVCNSHHQPVSILSITEDGKLREQSTYSDDEDLYEYMSSNTTLPIVVLEPAIGMTADEVICSTWGYPSKKNITETASLTKEQWVYDDGYIYLTGGIVTAIQKSE